MYIVRYSQNILLKCAINHFCSYTNTCTLLTIWVLQSGTSQGSDLRPSLFYTYINAIIYFLYVAYSTCWCAIQLTILYIYFYYLLIFRFRFVQKERWETKGNM